MNNRKLSLGLALAAGLLGGVLASYIAPPAAFGQNQAPVTKEIRAQSFTLVDPLDRTVGTFTFEPTDNLLFAPQSTPGRPMPMRKGRIVLHDSNGREIWSAGGSPIRELSGR